VHSKGELLFSEITDQDSVDLTNIRSVVVAPIGDFDPKSILTQITFWKFVHKQECWVI